MRQYRGGFGHNPSGKQYTYWGKDGMRVGQRVVAPVTHWRTGRTYKTMFTIQQSNAADSTYAEKEAERLSDKGVGLKYIQGGTNVLDLPGGQKWQDLAAERGMSQQQAKTLWSLDSNIKYGNRHGNNTAGKELMRDRLMGISKNNQQNDTQALEQLTGE